MWKWTKPPRWPTKMADSCPTPTPTANPFRDKPFMCTSPTPPPILLCLRVQLRAKKKNQVSIVQSTQLWAGQHEHQCSDHPVPASRVCVSSNGPQTTRKIQIHRCIVTFNQIQFNALLPFQPAQPLILKYRPTIHLVAALSTNAMPPWLLPVPSTTYNAATSTVPEECSKLQCRSSIVQPESQRYTS